MTFLLAFLATVDALKATDPTDELCCIFAEDLTERLYGKAVVERVPAAMWRLFPSTRDAWSPVTACFQAGIAEPGSRRETVGGAAPHLDEGRVHRMQGWRDKPFGASGHTITIVGGHGGTALVFDSAKDPRGARCTLVVWADYCAQYKGGIALCVLKATQ